MKNLQGSTKELPLFSPIECATFLGKRFSSSQRLMVYLSVRSCAGCRPKNSACNRRIKYPSVRIPSGRFQRYERSCIRSAQYRSNASCSSSRPRNVLSVQPRNECQNILYAFRRMKPGFRNITTGM